MFLLMNLLIWWQERGYSSKIVLDIQNSNDNKPRILYSMIRRSQILVFLVVQNSLLQCCEM